MGSTETVWGERGDLDVAKEKIEEPKCTRVTPNSKNKGSVIGRNSSLADEV